MASQIPWPMRKTILTTAATLGVVGIGGALLGPASDLVIIASAWTAMIMTLSSQAGALPMSKESAARFVAALISEIVLFAGGMKVGAMCAGLTGIGTPVAILLNVAGNSGITYLCGVAIATILLEKRQLTLDDLTVVAASALGHAGSTAAGAAKQGCGLGHGPSTVREAM